MERIIKEKVDDIYDASMELICPPGEIALSILKSGKHNVQEKRAALVVRTQQIILQDRKNNPIDFSVKLI